MGAPLALSHCTRPLPARPLTPPPLPPSSPRWDIPSVTGLSEEGLQAQEFVCALPDRIRRLAERKAARKTAKGAAEAVRFSWVHNHPLTL